MNPMLLQTGRERLQRLKTAILGIGLGLHHILSQVDSFQLSLDI